MVIIQYGNMIDIIFKILRLKPRYWSRVSYIHKNWNWVLDVEHYRTYTTKRRFDDLEKTSLEYTIKSNPEYKVEKFKITNILTFKNR